MTDVSRGSILLVDDDDLVLRNLSMALGDAGFNVTTADNGRFAVELCEGEVFDVVVCDMRMPGMSGIETLRAIKAVRPQVRTIVITGYAEDPQSPANLSTTASSCTVSREISKVCGWCRRMRVLPRN